MPTLSLLLVSCKVQADPDGDASSEQLERAVLAARVRLAWRVPRRPASLRRVRSTFRERDGEQAMYETDYSSLVHCRADCIMRVWFLIHCPSA